MLKVSKKVSQNQQEFAFDSGYIGLLQLVLSGVIMHLVNGHHLISSIEGMI